MNKPKPSENEEPEAIGGKTLEGSGFENETPDDEGTVNNRMMTLQEIHTALSKIAALDNQMSTGVIRGQLQNCFNSVPGVPKFQDLTEGNVALKPGFYDRGAARDCIENAVKQLDQDNYAGMLQSVEAALRHISVTP